MRAVRKLERRFNDALASLEKKNDSSNADAEISKLSKQIEALSAEDSKKDQKIDELTKELSTATEAVDKAGSSQLELTKQNEIIQNEVSALKTQLDKANEAEAAAQNKITEMQQQLDDIDGIKADSAELTNVKIQLVDEQSKSETYDKRIEELSASLQQMRHDQENNVVNAEDLNVAMKAELDTLNRQRANDINEVNAIIEKLTPLVGAK